MDPVQPLCGAAEAIRAFNHLTFPRPDQPPALPYPGNAYDAIGALKTLAQRLPQTFTQTGNALERLVTAGHLSAVHGTPVMHVTETQDLLRDAGDLAARLAAVLERAHSAVSPLSYSGPDDEPEEEPCGEGMCQCYCIGVLHPCGCDCPHTDDCDCDFCAAIDQY
ncbi:hypothetical protein ABT009_35385 [Streptomyces sp. NPDC002896]|uniref:hypothetical protein n=1 Tax=Streptomyces sp. NPDC002896 TaxID=3154438 RepID=UPI00331CA087